MPKPKAKTKLKPSTSAALILIGAWKLVEALALIIVAIGLHHYLNRDITRPILHLVQMLRMDPDNHYIHQLLIKVFSISPKQIRALSLGSLVYAALRLTEGVGLVLRKRWAEYLVVVSTGLMIPLEAYELFHRFTPIRLGVLLVNAAVVWYLARNLRSRG